MNGISIFVSLCQVGLEKLAFEHRGWQANQCSTFASIFADAIKHGLPAIQTQHPGLYYQQAANYAVQRRKLAEELCRLDIFFIAGYGYVMIHRIHYFI